MNDIYNNTKICNQILNQFRKLRDHKVPHQNIFCQWKNSFWKNFQSAKMTHFHPRMTTNDAQTLVTNQFDLVTFSQLCDLDHRKPRRFYIRCSYLHAARSIKKMRTWQPNKKGSGGVMKEKHHRVTGFWSLVCLEHLT